MRAYKKADIDGNGDLSKDEFCQMLKSCRFLGPAGLDLNDNDFVAFWKTIDTDNGESLDYGEIEDWFRRLRREKNSQPESPTTSKFNSSVAGITGVAGGITKGMAGVAGGIKKPAASMIPSSAFGRASIKRGGAGAGEQKGGPSTSVGEVV